MKFLKLCQLRSIENFLLTETDTAKNSLSFQLTNINGNIPKLKDEKIYNLSLIKIGEKRKRQMSKPV